MLHIYSNLPSSLKKEIKSMNVNEVVFLVEEDPEGSHIIFYHESRKNCEIHTFFS